MAVEFGTALLRPDDAQGFACLHDWLWMMITTYLR